MAYRVMVYTKGKNRMVWKKLKKTTYPNREKAEKRAKYLNNIGFPTKIYKVY